MIDSLFSSPGDKDLKRILGPDPKEPEIWKLDPKPKAPGDSLGRGGGGISAGAKQTLEDRRTTELAKEPPPEPYEFPTLEPSKPEEEVQADTAVLTDAKWVEPDTLFHQEAEVSVKLALPKEKEHVTKVQVELFAKTPSGPVPISKGEGWAQADGTAVVSVPVYKPKSRLSGSGHGSGPGQVDGPVDYFFRVMHSLAKILTTEAAPRQVSETTLKSSDHILIAGATFETDSSFIGPKGTQGLKPLEAKFDEWEKKYPKKAQIAVFGHADKDEKDAKRLSERRAQSAFAFITNDATTWEVLYQAEKWGLKALQTLLKDLGHYHGTADGKDGPNTQEAFKAFQKGAGLPESGKEDSATRKALFAAYMKGKHDIKIEASRFLKVAGHAWMGCAAHNQVKESEGAAPENRRVAFVLINPSKHFPVNFPCEDGSEAACLGQCKKTGKRSGAGIKCLFYDEMVREEKQTAAATATDHEEKHESNESTLKTYSVEKAVAHLDENASDKSQGSCARYVRLAIEAGGGKIKPPNPLSAKDYGSKLTEIGFRKIDTAGFVPQKGDVVVFQAPSTSPHGHIQMFNGTIWVSDFRQHDASDMYPGSRYREEKISYEIYRP